MSTKRGQGQRWLSNHPVQRALYNEQWCVMHVRDPARRELDDMDVDWSRTHHVLSVPGHRSERVGLECLLDGDLASREHVALSSAMRP